ncbi:MAG: PorV/PorQ family protein [Elusimicrobia bacterium]|nr:PorV/PorQ family protein [Elusimicrobiota bacterium]
MKRECRSPGGNLWATLVAGFALFGPSSLFAGGKAGTNGAPFLQIAAGARAAALGGAYTALADDASSLMWNPAGLARVQRGELAATHTQWLQNADHDFLAGAIPTRWGTLAVGAVTLSVPDIPKRLTDTDAADGTFDSRDAAYSLGYGRTVGTHWALGLSAQYIRRTLDGSSAAAPAASLGAQWKTPFSFLTLGASLRNIGGDITFNEEGDPLPMTASVGAAARFLKDRLALALDARSVRDQDASFGLGCEYAPRLFKDGTGALSVGIRFRRRHRGRNGPDARGGARFFPLGPRCVLGALRSPGRLSPLRFPFFLLKEWDERNFPPVWAAGPSSWRLYRTLPIWPPTGAGRSKRVRTSSKCGRISSPNNNLNPNSSNEPCDLFAGKPVGPSC